MIVNKYPDGSSYVQTQILKADENIMFKINTYEDLWHLNQFVDAYINKFKESPTVTIPSLIDAQADRRFASNQSSGLKLVCTFLNRMNANFRIFHPHNPEVVEALMDRATIMDNNFFVTKAITGIDRTYKHTKKNPENNLILMSSDAGGFKPLMKLCDTIDWKGETYSASKARTEEGMKQLIDRQDFGGKDILIVDDICVYGGTFKGLATMLRERNCGKLYLAVSHMTVQELGTDPVTHYFDKVFTTNSKYDTYYYSDGKTPETNTVPINLEVIKLF